MAAVVNVLKAQKLYLKLVECAMNQTYTNFNRVHDLVHDAEDKSTSDEAEVNETFAVIAFVAEMCRKLHQPRLTVLINSSEAQVGPGRGFWKDLGVKIDLADTHMGAFYCLMRGECYNHFAAFCAHNDELQQYVWERVLDGLGIETEEGEYINQVIREQVAFYAQASTNLDQIYIDEKNPLNLRVVHKEFFLRMRMWLDQACRLNDSGRLVWDGVFLTQAAKRLRREFTLTVPLNHEWDLYALTLAKELKEGELYCPLMDHVEILTVCKMNTDSVSIEHVPVKNGEFIKSVVGDSRALILNASVGDTSIGGAAHPEKCTIKTATNQDYSHATVRVSFRLS